MTLKGSSFCFKHKKHYVKLWGMVKFIKTYQNVEEIGILAKKRKSCVSVFFKAHKSARECTLTL